MGDDTEHLKYFMASERTMNMIFVIEQTLEFMGEYKIEADEAVKKAIWPLIKQLQDWTAK